MGPEEVRRADRFFDDLIGRRRGSLRGEDSGKPGPGAVALPACRCPLGTDGETLRRRLAATIERGLTTTTPHATGAVIGQRGPTGIFANSYDYHSAVHAHWAVLNLYRVSNDQVAHATALARTSEANLAAEWAFLQRVGNRTFELPYGRAWLALLLSEISNVPARRTAVARRLRRRVEQQVLTWLENNTASAGNNNTIGAHDSWLFALLLLVMANPVLPSAARRIAALERTVVASHRTRWRGRSSLAHDFLHVPSIIDTLDLLRGRTAHRTASNMPASRIPTVTAGHQVGEEMTRLWPVAILSRRSGALCTVLQTRLRQWLAHPQHWEQNFAANSHWTPQFLWMAIRLRC